MKLNKMELSASIKAKQKVMYKIAKQYGFTHPHVVAYSQSLDVLINNYQNKDFV